MATKAEPCWKKREMRLNPYSMPHRVGYDPDATFSYKIDRHGAVLKRRLDCGLPVSVALPQKAFKGVAARIVERPNQPPLFMLELHHVDAQMCLPVLISESMDDIAADWHSWSRLMGLPMLLVDRTNQANPLYAQLGQLLVNRPIARRKRISMVKHRPWFLRRRKCGNPTSAVQLTPAEIIART